MNYNIIICVSILVIILCMSYTYDEYLKRTYGKLDYRKYDPMNIKLFEIGDCKIGGWPFSHFFLHFVLGMIAPQYWHIWTSIGIGWEICEFYVGYNTHKFNDTDNELIYKTEFYGNNYDPATNVIGLLCGMTVNRIINKIVV